MLVDRWAAWELELVLMEVVLMEVVLMEREVEELRW